MTTDEALKLATKAKRLYDDLPYTAYGDWRMMFSATRGRVVAGLMPLVPQLAAAVEELVNENRRLLENERKAELVRNYIPTDEK